MTVAHRGLLVVAVLFACWLALPGRAEAQAAEPPNIVLVLTDDQRWDTLGAMPTVQRELVAKGVTFTNAFATNPLCCPSRATLLTGRYSHGTGVYLNTGRFGGFGAFDPSSTVATWLDGRGYTTALVGKYLNGYVGSEAPPGWDRWIAFSGAPDYFNYTLALNGLLTRRGSLPADYSTDVLADEAASFIRSTDGPIFLHFSPFAPHFRRVSAFEVTPAPRHEGAFASLRPWRPASYNERDVRDKPAWLRLQPSLTPERMAKGDAFRTQALESLLAVDEAVGEIVDALAETGRLANTVLIFASDNGNAWGEHRWFSKIVPYEESIRVPLVVRYDALGAAPRRDDHLVVNVDLAPTIAQLVGTRAPGAEGRSLVPLLTSPSSPWRRDFLLEHLADGPRAALRAYCGIRSPGETYVQYANGEEELYNLRADPHQLLNVARAPAQRRRLVQLRARLRMLCNPPPRGFKPRSPCHMLGTPGANRFRGTDHHDRICAGSGGDRVYGRGTGDTLLAGPGNDLVQGGSGPDVVYSGRGRDRVSGNSGNDTIYAADGRLDVLRCGPGFDTVQVDRRDRVSLCERVRRLGS